MSKGIKFLGLTLSIAVINIIALSPGLVGIQIGGESAFQTAFGVALLTVSVILLLYGIYGLFFKPAHITPIKELKTYDDYVLALSRYQGNKVLKNDISFALKQTARLNKKKETLIQILSERFEPTELSYNKFLSVINEVEKLFYLNLKNILNKVSVFDESEYKSIIDKDTTPFSKKLLQEKKELYDDYISYVKKAVSINEEILVDLDKLLLEITELNSFDIEDFDNLACIKEMDSLIKQTKYYKQ